jgi:DNA polymerase-3 subunit beta
MKFTVDQQPFAKALKSVAAAAAKNKLRPILGHLHLAAGKEGDLRITGADEMMRISAWCDAKVAVPGAVCLPADILAKTVAGFPEGEVNLEVGERHKTLLSVEKSKARLDGMDPIDYPRTSSPAKTSQVTVPAAEVLRLLSPVLHAASTDETTSLAHLGGIFLETDTRKDEDGQKVPIIGACAFDGKRASLITLGADFAGLAIDQGVLLPLRAAKEMVRLLEGALADASKQGATEVEADVSIGWLQDVGSIALEMGLSVGDITLTSKFIDAQYPDVRRNFPTRFKAVVEVPRKPFAEALKRISIIARKDDNHILTEISEGVLRLASDAPNVGDAEEEIEIEYSGNPFFFYLFGNFYQEALDSISTPNVAIGVNDDLSPVLLRPVGQLEHRTLIGTLRGRRNG